MSVYVCFVECDPEMCESDVPSCRDDQTLIASRTDGGCCLTHICSQLANQFMFHHHRQPDSVLSHCGCVCLCLCMWVRTPDLCSVLLLY